MTVLILPGINDSGPTHWQTLWEKAHPTYQRITGQDWDHPVQKDWVASLEAAVRKTGPRTILVAHSLACLQVAHWSAASRTPIQSALLVAPPDPKRPAFPKTAKGFGRVSRKKLRFPSILVASSNDPYADPEFSRLLAQDWGSEFVSFGRKGHLNKDSGLKDWLRGFKLLELLIKKGI